MPAKKIALTKQSEPDAVEACVTKLKDPMTDVASALRTIISSVDPEIGEAIKWNAPAFFYVGEMPSCNPKEHKRHIVVFNLYKQDCLRLVFPSGARVKDESGLLEGNYPDGRSLALFHNMTEVESRKANLQGIVKQRIVSLDKE